jgi:hypothetical protein
MMAASSIVNRSIIRKLLLWACSGPAITRKVKVMFRKMAIALVAASVFTAPVLAQNPPLSGGSTTSPSNETTEKATKPEKTEKPGETTEKVEKKVTRHYRTVHHHRHGTKVAKAGKPRTRTAMSARHPSAKAAKYAKHPRAKTAKYAKVEGRRVGHGRTPPKHVYGKAPKRSMPSGTTTH